MPNKCQKKGVNEWIRRTDSPEKGSQFPLHRSRRGGKEDASGQKAQHGHKNHEPDRFAQRMPRCLPKEAKQTYG